MKAVVDTVKPPYAFAKTEGTHERVFIHDGDGLDFLVSDLQKHDVIEIEQIEQGPRGPRARTAWFVERPTRGRSAEGIVVHVDFVKKFALVRPADKFDGTFGRSGLDIMCHVTGAFDYDGDSNTFNRLARGTKVTGHVRDTERGRRFQDYEIV
jgi:cold shock CspA family protein